MMCVHHASYRSGHQSKQLKVESDKEFFYAEVFLSDDSICIIFVNSNVWCSG